MKTPRKLWATAAVLGLAGIGLFVALLIRHSFSDIVGAIAAAGWGVALVVGFHIFPLLINTFAWRVLFPPDERMKVRTLLFIRWIAESVGTLMPATQVGGEIVRARLAALKAASVAQSAATVIGDVTIGIGAQIIFTLSGLFLLARLTGRDGLVLQSLAGAAIGLVVVGGFYAVQHFGIFRIASTLMSRIVSADSWTALKEHGEALDSSLRAIYQRRRDCVASFFWSLANWLVGAGEIYIALRVLGTSHGYAEAVVLESVAQGVRAVLFLIPGAVGVQEGGYVVVGAWLRIPGDTAMALALIRRVRELSFGIPGLVAWQWVEGRRLWRSRTSPTVEADAAAPAPAPCGVERSFE